MLDHPANAERPGQLMGEEDDRPIQVEILDADGQPIPGYTRADYKDRLWGNQTEERAQWKEKGTVVSELKGTPVRLKFYIREGDLYAIQFRKAGK